MDHEVLGEREGAIVCSAWLSAECVITSWKNAAFAEAQVPELYNSD